MGDALDVITEAMRKVIHRVDAPLAASMMMLSMANAIKHRVAHPDVWRGHVDFGAQSPSPVGELCLLHASEQVQVLFQAPVAKGAVFAGPIGRPAICIGVFGGKIIDIR